MYIIYMELEVDAAKYTHKSSSELLCINRSATQQQSSAFLLSILLLAFTIHKIIWRITSIM